MGQRTHLFPDQDVKYSFSLWGKDFGISPHLDWGFSSLEISQQ